METDNGSIKYIERSNLYKKLEKFEFLFFWLRIFYPRAKGVNYINLLAAFFYQKILMINWRVPWPVHFTSKVYHHKKIKVGYNTAPGANSCSYIQGRNGIIMGDNVQMGPGIGLISANHDPNDYDRWIISDPIQIGNNVWIGMNTVIMPGVKVGDNVIIGANSVVTKDITSDSIAFGSPCKVVKSKSPYLGKAYATEA